MGPSTRGATPWASCTGSAERVDDVFGKDEHEPCLFCPRTLALPTVPSMSFLAPVIALYDYALRPVPPLAWLGVPATALDIAGALRLAVTLRQLREVYYEQYVSKAAPTGPRTRSGGKSGGRSGQRAASDELSESRSRVREFMATLVIVHGGEAIVGTWTVYYSIPRVFNLLFFR